MAGQIAGQSKSPIATPTVEAASTTAAGSAEAVIHPVSSDFNEAERRVFPRQEVDCPVTVSPVSGAVTMKGQLSNLSLGGCLVVLPHKYLAGILVRVEAQFQLRGIAFRLLGVTVGARGALSFAVRFLDMTAKRREELSEVLAEVAALHAAKAAGAVLDEASASLPAPQQAMPEGKMASAPEAPVSTAAEPVSNEATGPALNNAAPAVSPSAGDRRVHGRLDVDTRVKLLLVKTAISMPGRILNLSAGGCRIRTDQQFNVGIYVRLEAEFYLHGLPFRVAGVSQAIQDRNTIGMRFLDMSDRRREQLLQLIAEIEAAHMLEPASQGADIAETAL